MSEVREARLPVKRERGEEVSVTIPREVRIWIDRKAGQAFRSRSGYLRDLLVSLYRKEHSGQS